MAAFNLKTARMNHTLQCSMTDVSVFDYCISLYGSKY